MQQAYNIILVLSAIVAVAFSVLVFATGKGDAMGGSSSSIRTTFKGKASFEDRISRVTFILGAAFMVAMLILDAIQHRLSDL